MQPFIVIVFLLSCFPAFSQDWISDDWWEDKAALKGNVRSVDYTSTVMIGDSEEDWMRQHYQYSYNVNGLLDRASFSDDLYGSEYNVIYRVYDETAMRCLTEYFLFERDTTNITVFDYNSTTGRLERSSVYISGSFWSTSQYSYNAAGLLTESVAIVPTLKDTLREMFEYDLRGYKVRHVDVSRSWMVVKSWVYDSEGNLTEERSELKTPSETIVHTIHENGEREVQKIANDPRDDRNYSIAYTYNDRKQITREVKKYLDGEVDHDILFSYGENGEITKETYILKDRKQLEKNIAYTYDLRGNWILKTSSWDSGVFKIEERVITYH